MQRKTYLRASLGVFLVLLGVLIGLSFPKPLSDSPGRTAVYEVLDPRGQLPDIARVPLTPRLDDLNGKTLYIVRSWPTEDGRFDTVISRLTSYLEQRFAGIEVVVMDRNEPYARDDPALWQILQDNADAFLYAAAPSAATTHYAFVWSALLEQRGLPGAVMLFEPLMGIQRTSSKLIGPPVRFTAFPFPADYLTDEEFESAFASIVGTLTDPLAESERQNRVIEANERPRILTRGSLTEIQQYLRREALTDGFPIIPPTQDRVDTMLAGTSHSPGEIVAAAMAPAGLEVTVEKVAVNAVLAGCGPEHLPVLLASIEAFGALDRTGIVRSTNSFGFMQIVNGPIRHEIGMNSGTGLLGPGNHANVCMGRALRLFVVNLGGGAVGENMMAQIGNMATYPMLFGENEEASPWPPLATDHGIREGDNALTMMIGLVGNTGSYGPWNFRLEHVAEDISEFEVHSVGATIIVTPPRAMELASAGMSKQDLKDFLQRESTKRLGELRTTRFFAESEQTRDLNGEHEVTVYRPGAMEVIVAGGNASTQMQAWNVGRPVTVSIDKWR